METNTVNCDLYRLNLNKAKLKAVTRTSTLFSGFAMVALVEMTIEINNDLNSDIPAIVLHGFTIITCLLIGVHLLALMISTCLLPQIETIIQHYDLFSANTSTFIETQKNKNLDTIINIPSLDRASPTGPWSSSVVNDTHQPHAAKLTKQESLKYETLFHPTLPFIKFQFYIELSWLLSNGVGIFLFLIQVAFVCFIKFSPMTNATHVYVSGWIIVFSVLVIFVLFSYRFYVLLVEYRLFNKKFDIELMDHDLKMLANLSIDKKKFHTLNKKRFTHLFQRNNNGKFLSSTNNNGVEIEEEILKKTNPMNVEFNRQSGRAKKGFFVSLKFNKVGQRTKSVS